MDWSLSPFLIDALFDGEAFPAVSAQQLGLFDLDGNALEESGAIPVDVDVPNTDDSPLMYLPYADIGCLINNFTANGVPLYYNETNGNRRAMFFSVNVTIEGELRSNYMAFSRDSWQNFYTNRRSLLDQLLYVLPNGSDFNDLSPVAMSFGDCFLRNTTTCR